jgi:hypothetical protein
MKLVTSIATNSAAYAKMTNRHIFVKHNNEGLDWTIISFKETSESFHYKSECYINETDTLQYIIGNENL